MFTKPENWNKLTAKEKMEARFNSWQSLAVEFASPEVKQAYQQRIQMIKDATYLKKPERIPIIPGLAFIRPNTAASPSRKRCMTTTSWARPGRNLMPTLCRRPGHLQPRWAG